MKKATALLITLIIISSIGLMALVVARTTLSGLMLATRISDEIIADEASFASLELFLYNIHQYNNLESLVGHTWNCNLANDITTIDNSSCPSSYTCPINASCIQIKPQWNGDNIDIFMTGIFGSSFKKHLFQIDEADEVRMVY